MKSMNDINKVVEGLRARYSYEGDAKAVLDANLKRLWEEFNQKLAEGLAPEEVNVALGPVKGAMGLLNDLSRNERLDQLKAMDINDAVEEYMRTQAVTGYAVKRTKVDSDYVYEVDSEAKVELSAYDMLCAVQPTAKLGIVDACCIFADNLVRLNHKGDNASTVSRVALSPSYVAMRKRMGWDIPSGQLSKGKLAEHLGQIVKWLCPGQDIRMLSTDVTYLMDTIIQGTGKADSAGGILVREEKTIVNAIFRAAYTRKNGLPYQFQNKTRAESDPASQKNNKDMAEAKPKKDQKPEVTAEHVEVPAETDEAA